MAGYHTRRQSSPPRAVEKRVAVYGHGRVCAEPTCATVLSAYNPSACCWLHEREALAVRARQHRKEGLRVDKSCAHDACARTFASTNPARRYCSDRCRMAAFQSRRMLGTPPAAASQRPESR